MDSSSEGSADRGSVRYEPALTHSNIARIIGTSRETVTRTLSEFRKLEITELNGSILTVRNPSALGRLAAA
jgi:CRP/FNR family cyclic AMP-dependent transcriptional regulator